MDTNKIRNVLIEKGFKVTPQRIAILEAIYNLPNHPSAENIIEYIRKNNPNIAPATVYKVLDVFISAGLIKRINTEKDVMRYDSVMKSHHHLYYTDSDMIEDYWDDELNTILENYFNANRIPGFKIEDLKLQILGRSAHEK